MKRSKPYNVLLLMTDQQRFDTLGCYDNPVVKTPNLDAVAREGTVFRAAYTACPSCVPARASLMTGMNQWHTGILGMGPGQFGMGDGFEHTLPGELSQAGYHTQGVGKMHFRPQRSLLGFHNTVLDESGRSEDPGFKSDYRAWFEANREGDDDIIEPDMSWNGWTQKVYHAAEYLHPNCWTVNESINFLKKRDPNKPFFLKASFARPHSPYDAVERFFEMYKDKQLPEAWIGDWAEMHDDSEEAAKLDAWRGKQDKQDIHKARAGYYGNITHIDQEIGRLLAYLDEIGELDDTMIIFTSDHGDMLGDHNLWRKTYAYEGSTHIPMLLRLPKDMQNGVRPESDKPVMLRDIMPTVLDVVGVDIPETVDGFSMLPLVKGEEVEWRDYIHGEHCTCYSPIQEMQYLTDGQVKYIWFPRLEENSEQLFNLTDDPGELVDLAQQEQWQDELLKWRRRLVAELEPRNLGLTDGEQLVCQKGKGPIVSPNYRRRLDCCAYDPLNYKWKDATCA